MGKDGTMRLKWMGALFIIAGCAGVGLMLSTACRREIRLLEKLLRYLEYMECELNFHQTALPQLCTNLSLQGSGVIEKIFAELAVQMDRLSSVNAAQCMQSAIHQFPDVPKSVSLILIELGRFLGCFDLEGQLQQLASIKAQCRMQLDALFSQSQMRLRNYQTLSLCAGAVLAILFL